MPWFMLLILLLLTALEQLVSTIGIIFLTED
jgi:hypothetical protein